MLTVIGFFSAGTPYEDEAKLLCASLDAVGMKYVVSGFTDRGDWYANTAAKAELIQGARQSMRGPLLYVDVDAYVHVNCAAWFQNIDADFGAHYFAGPAKGRPRGSNVCRCLRGMRCSQPHRLLSGTLYFADTPKAHDLCDTWVEFNAFMRSRRLVQGGGQKNLWYLVTCMEKAGLKVERLPGRFCRVFDKPEAYPRKEPVWIEHTIGSRENRGSVRVNPGRRAKIAELKQTVGL